MMVFMATNREIKPDGVGRNRNPQGVTWWYAEQKPFVTATAWIRFSSDVEALAAIHGSGKPILLVIHGFNNSAQKAWGTLQAIYDHLAERFALIIFCWDSEGNIFEYLQDRVRAEQSAPDLLEVLLSLKKPHILAHSMGNFLLEQCLKRRVFDAGKPINGLAMVAADVPFTDLGSSNIAQCAEKVIVLFCPVDGALDGSALLRLGVFRLGESGPLGDCPANCSAVDCTNLLPAEIDTIRLHGDYFTDQACYDVMARVWADAAVAAG